MAHAVSDLQIGQKVTRLKFARRQYIPGIEISFRLVTKLVVVFLLMVNSAWARAHPTGAWVWQSQDHGR